MGLRSQIESAERRLNKVLPVVSPPTLKMNIYTEEEWNNKKPIEEDQWALSLIIEEKRPLIVKDQANSLDASRFSLSSTCK